ncbi:eukaryotic phosphomannomutase [Xylaria bambusicola]|uniref:eukaryotic phosphomannomutase n=1 Tax=Xylaria bambusicola TaxID=326684 RepID=UPI002008B278|nr:eukaryotic phosphomannomutase [Xylaria bambusicola]KAI0521682.1 eukaryotic phosphomannomutase [Xylaria bambusicola]
MTATKSFCLPLEERPLRNTICLFDLDGTLCAQEQLVSEEMHEFLYRLRQKCAIGYVSGGPLVKQQRQAGKAHLPVTALFDFSFAENGLTAFRMGIPMLGESFIEYIGEIQYKQLVTWILRYIADLGIPVKHGTFVELRNGNVNICLIGQGSSNTEMEKFERYDKKHRIRKTMITAIEREFSYLNLKCAIGGKACFDVFPKGWDKTYCLRHIEAEKHRSGITYNKILFFGDCTYEGGNDAEICEDSRTIGHTVMGPNDTMRLVKEYFDM